MRKFKEKDGKKYLIIEETKDVEHYFVNTGETLEQLKNTVQCLINEYGEDAVFNCDPHWEGGYFQISYERLETDKERERRLKSDKKKAEKTRKENAKKEERERKELERLAKKYKKTIS